MSLPVRQNNLFAAEDFTKVYRAFKQVDFKSYDFDSIRSALVEYIKNQYPEDFNDYIESSEFIAIIEMLAYLGTSLAFRTDLNSRENFLDTAERRDSVIRLARMLSYAPSRNRPAKGLFKLTAAETTEPLSDSTGRSLKGRTIFWGDSNNPDATEQFTTVLNAAFNSRNPFGRPVKSQIVQGIDTSLYQINTATNVRVAIPISLRVRGNNIPADVVNVDINDVGSFVERNPDPLNAFHIVHRNDGNGVNSINTGFFVFVKQGELKRQDFSFDNPIENRVQFVDNLENINEEDVYLSEVKDDGTVIDHWKRVPNLIGNNIIFNSQELSKRKIFSVIPENNDQITLKFTDSNFGEVPRGKFRLWARESANSELLIRPEESSGYQITLPYVGKNDNEYILTMTFSLQETINNAAPTETIEDIKERAPQVFYTQNRMVNAEDYNVFPLNRGNEIEKIRAINRTHSGHSRFIDINDPTGSHNNVLVNGNDGAIYKDFEPKLKTINIDSIFNVPEFIEDDLTEFIGNKRLQNWFYDVYMKNKLSQDANVFDSDTFGVSNQKPWTTKPDLVRSATGYFYNTIQEQNSNDFRYFREGSVLKIKSDVNDSDIRWRTVRSIKNGGIPDSQETNGPVTLNAELDKDFLITQIYPPLRTIFTDSEITKIKDQINLQNDFAIGFDIDTDEWYIISADFLNPDLEAFDLESRNTQNDSSWLVEFNYDTGDNASNPKYKITTKGIRYIFESLREVRFFFNEEQNALDIETGLSLKDEIILPKSNKGRYLTETWEYDSGFWSDGKNSYEYNSLGIIVLKDRNVNASNVSVTPSLTNGDQSDFEIKNGIIDFDGGFTPVDGDTITVDYLDGRIELNEDLVFHTIAPIILEDGHQDARKVEIASADSDEDGIPEVPFAFDLFVAPNENVYHEQFTDFDNYEYSQLWEVGIQDIGTIQNSGDLIIDSESRVINGISIFNVGLYIFDDFSSIEEFTIELNSLASDTSFISLMSGKKIFDQTTEQFWQFTTTQELPPRLLLKQDNAFTINTGRSFTLNTLTDSSNYEPLYYTWNHYAPRNNRIDPSVNNIIDMYILTTSYYNRVKLWKKENKSRNKFPVAPTPEQLNIQFSNLNKFKMVSDELIFNPVQFKLLFGEQADDELQARFQVVKLPTSSITDNEIKSQVIEATDEFFAIDNWDFGEGFFYTELASYIHSKLASHISTIVIVPTKADSQFGNLFQIKAEPNQLFLSTATVQDVEIVNNLTEKNLRLNSENQ